MRILKYIILLLSIFTLTMCKVGSKYKQPELATMPDTFDNLTTDSGSVADIGWSTLYTDPILQEYIGKALMHNKDILIAAARIKEMEANKRISFANLFPQIGIAGKGEREFEYYGGDTKKFKTEYNANVNVSWELDIWGNLRWANEAGVAAYLQTLEARRWLQLTIIAQVAQAYFELESLDKELQIVKQTLEARRQGVKFAKLRYDGGLTSEIPYRQSLVELARTETLIPSLEQSVKLKENDLFILIGEYPSGSIGRGTGFDTQLMPADLPIELPSTLLQRRPDMIQAEQQLIEANAKVGVALTDMFPRIGFSGRIGAENDALSQLFKSPGWLINGAITGPLFNMGKNKAKHNAAKAAYEQVILGYEKKVLDVFREVNNSIISVQKSKEVRKSRSELYQSTKTNERLAQLQYVNGIVSYIDLLDAQRQLFDAEIALNKAHLNELLSVVALYKALGGGLAE